MKGSYKTFTSFLFFFAVAILLIRPIIIFSSNTAHLLINVSVSKSFEIQKVVKKRRETVRLNNMITKEVEEITLANSVTSFLIIAQKIWLQKVLLALSSLLSLFTFFKRRSTFFEIIPDNHHYLALSVFRI